MQTRSLSRAAAVGQNVQIAALRVALRLMLLRHLFMLFLAAASAMAYPKLYVARYAKDCTDNLTPGQFYGPHGRMFGSPVAAPDP
jgi:hypothetical protein